ncbi:hypothetical protein Adeg_0615 [Ammonifex degensii KC4]|uniref:Uncharacterized protein n=1 Tax=Ammonifex degensii (strain DSM 10501 / KC4) TaxID=429009 RepID=C9RBY6_AMMDK|nr:hypothetical protein [Ammonifex degensii]ACX51763.1 hypothetical protein Adeg_0615 [Ammonifex degensii KC4]
MDIKEAINRFAEKADSIPAYLVRGRDYAFPVEAENHLYLVVETQGKGIFLARFAPDFLKPHPLNEEEQEKARSFAVERLKEAGLWPQAPQ